MIGLNCECGGEYRHLDQEEDLDTVVDTYQCRKCGTFCLITWDFATEFELDRAYAVVEGEYEAEPGFPYLAFCPISIYDPAKHDPANCPYCRPGGEMTEEASR